MTTEKDSRIHTLAEELGVSEEEALEALVDMGRENPDDLLRRCSSYRRRRKYTVLSLSEYLSDDATAQLREAIGSEYEGPLLAWELVAFLRTQETVMPEWKIKRLPPADGVPRKRGRPRKHPPHA